MQARRTSQLTLLPRCEDAVGNRYAKGCDGGDEGNFKFILNNLKSEKQERNQNLSSIEASAPSCKQL